MNPRLREAETFAEGHGAGYESGQVNFKPRHDSRVCFSLKGWLVPTVRKPRRGRGQSCGKCKVSSTLMSLGAREDGWQVGGQTQPAFRAALQAPGGPGRSDKNMKFLNQLTTLQSSAPPLPSRVTLGNILIVPDLQ